VALEVVAELVPLEPSSAGGAGALGGPSGLFCEVRPATINCLLCALTAPKLLNSRGTVVNRGGRAADEEPIFRWR
jgi:hypothetical protein